jgi:hypothetical protein
MKDGGRIHRHEPLESVANNRADGPCSVHVNLGQVGFVFIEANVPIALSTRPVLLTRLASVSTLRCDVG